MSDLVSALARRHHRSPIAVVAPKHVGAVLAICEAAAAANVPVVLGSRDQRHSTFGPEEQIGELAVVRLRTRPDPAARVLAATSGTSGPARFVVWTDAMLEYQARATSERIATDNATRYGLALSPTGAYGFSVVNLAARIGGSVVQLEPAGLERIVRTVIAGTVDTVDAVPGVWRYLMSCSDSCRDLRIALRRLSLRGVGGEVVPHSLLDAYMNIEAPLHNGYGLTEAGPNVAISYGAAFGVHTVGTPLTGTEVRVSDDGGIFVRGPAVATQVLEPVTGQFVTNPEVDAEGWLDTGDIGLLDEAGQIVILGRSDGYFVGHGRKLHSSVIENVFREICPISADIVALQLDPYNVGRAQVVVVILSDGGTTLSTDDTLTTRMRSFPPEFRARYVVHMDRDLVRMTSSGKLDRRQLSIFVCTYLRTSHIPRQGRTQWLHVS